MSAAGALRPEALLDAAAALLGRAGFAVRISQLEGSNSAWLLAENELFALGAVAGETLDELEPIESVASQALLAMLGGLEGGAKRWDAYLVLLTPQRFELIDTRNRVEVEYNTRGIRRLVGAQVLPDDEGDLEPALARALTPFLPLREPFGSGLEDVDAALIRALVLNGVEPEAAPRFVAAYRAHRSLDDV